MCGIIGVIGGRNATPLLLAGLKRLEYRGYDSAGVVVGEGYQLRLARAKGKLVNLEQLLDQTPLAGTRGVGHTRWATHGPPTERNAHPHVTPSAAVVHNGIIENYQELRSELIALGVEFSSETDTEVIPHLITLELLAGREPLEAVCRAINRLHGAFALGIVLRDHPDLLIAARRGSPLILGLGEGENFIASDATPLVPYTRRMIYLNDDDVALLEKDRVTITDLHGQPVERPVKISQVAADFTEKWPHDHFMKKEIHEQPTAIGETLKQIINPATRQVEFNWGGLADRLDQVTALSIVACGTSWHAGMVGKYWIEQYARLPVTVDVASEYRYREPPSLPGTMCIAISQSGETADTLAALRYARGCGQPVLGIVNVMESTIARESDAVIYTLAGPEIGVASTKAFTTQLTVLAALAIALGRATGVLSLEREEELVTQLLHLPGRMEQVLTHDAQLLAAARQLVSAKGFLFLGRGACFPIALEGALKLKEISYLHAEGYAAGEMKHGPIALIDEQLPVVVLAPRDRLFEKVLSNLEEVRARGGRLVLLTTEGYPPPAVEGDIVIQLVAGGDFTTPILYVVPLQMLAYHIAVLKGTDVDQPRNLAKSVTVE